MAGGLFNNISPVLSAVTNTVDGEHSFGDKSWK